jgi:hypothetical protein
MVGHKVTPEEEVEYGLLKKGRTMLSFSPTFHIIRLFGVLVK